MGLFGFGKGSEVPFPARQGGGEVGAPKKDYLSPDDPLPDEVVGGTKEIQVNCEQSVREALENVVPENPEEAGGQPGTESSDEERFSVSKLNEKHPGVTKFLTGLMVVSLASSIPKRAEAGNLFDRVIDRATRQVERSIERTASRTIRKVTNIPRKEVDRHFDEYHQNQREKQGVMKNMKSGVSKFAIESESARRDLEGLRSDYDRDVREQEDLGRIRERTTESIAERRKRIQADYMKKLENMRDRFEKKVERIEDLSFQTRIVYGNSEKVQRHLDEFEVLKTRRVSVFNYEADALYNYIVSGADTRYSDQGGRRGESISHFTKSDSRSQERAIETGDGKPTIDINALDDYLRHVTGKESEGKKVGEEPGPSYRFFE